MKASVQRPKGNRAKEINLRDLPRRHGAEGGGGEHGRDQAGKRIHRGGEDGGAVA